MLAHQTFGGCRSPHQAPDLSESPSIQGFSHVDGEKAHVDSQSMDTSRRHGEFMTPQHFPVAIPSQVDSAVIDQ